MNSWIGLATVLMAAPAMAGSYHIVLDTPARGRLIEGHAGLQAADERTATALVRLISPGNEVDERGTVRVLVMNLGTEPFEVGPDEVTIRLGDGTILKPTSVDSMEKGRVLVEREAGHAATIDMANRNSFSSLAGQTAGGSAPTPGVSAPGANELTHVAGQEHRADMLSLPGGRLLDAIYQMLMPLDVGPGQAWGGYYVFEVPKEIRRQRTDLPLSIVIRTGTEPHEFTGRLHRN